MRSISLSTHQIFRATIMGVILWFFAALLLRYFGPMGAFEGIARIVTYALIIPGTLPFVFLVKKIAGLASDQIAIGYSVATAAAMLCDGIALAWLPGLYGGSSELVAGSGAAILWGAGIGIVLACVVNKQQQ
jgi:hypothetical protein